MAWLKFGELDGPVSPRLGAIDEACAKAGVEALISSNIIADIWRKFAFLAPMANRTTRTPKKEAESAARRATPATP